jgi:hypothetical protein
VKILLHCLLSFGLCALCSAWGDAGEQTVLRTFKHAPFPLIDTQAKTFFDVLADDGRRGRNSPRGGLLWEDITYTDDRVLLTMPTDFNGRRRPTLIVYLHGNQAILERDVWERQQVPAQVISADINAFLVAPQFAVDALDSSPGNFAEKNYFTKFVKETAAQASDWQNDKHLEYQLKHAPIIVVAYSGGYFAAAHILEKGGVSRRVKGVILLDALYGREAVFAKWLSFNHRKSFLFSAYTEPARASNEVLQNMLRDRRIKFATGMPELLLKNSITFMQLDETTVHKDLLTQAWSSEPLADLLRKTKVAKPAR